ncbi:MAG: hypothetical protein A2Y38_26680 [Spirochaetes bacterium GWB1_59_5]|nr:MAG: hypothetical protein A2Y38_26680 [Spirochaetes bacterium GWB1_59_5]
MPKPVNAFVQISKKLASLQAKSSKINEEINALVEIVALEVRKQETAPAPVVAAKATPAKAAPAKVAPAKAAPAKATTSQPKADAPAAASKKRGRPSKK